MTGGCQQRYCSVCFVRLNGGGSVFCSEGGGDCAAFLLAWFRPSKQSTCRLRAAHGSWACFPTPVSFDSVRIAAHTRTILDTFSTSLPDEGSSNGLPQGCRDQEIPTSAGDVFNRHPGSGITYWCLLSTASQSRYGRLPVCGCRRVRVEHREPYFLNRRRSHRGTVLGTPSSPPPIPFRLTIRSMMWPLRLF